MPSIGDNLASKASSPPVLSKISWARPDSKVSALPSTASISFSKVVALPSTASILLWRVLSAAANSLLIAALSEEAAVLKLVILVCKLPSAAW